MDQLPNWRVNYESGRLTAADLLDDPIALFQEWLQAARQAAIVEPQAMTLATADADGQPSARMVLLKGVDRRGFRFFSNYESRKAVELATNPQAALLFFWDRLQRQVRVEGTVAKITISESTAYFQSRPRASQLGAWSSPQSAVLSSRDDLRARLQATEKRFADDTVLPLPPFWGGFRLQPQRIEFWQGRSNRLHDRFRYTRLAEDGWQIERLAP